MMIHYRISLTLVICVVIVNAQYNPYNRWRHRNNGRNDNLQLQQRSYPKQSAPDPSIIDPYPSGELKPSPDVDAGVPPPPQPKPTYDGDKIIPVLPNGGAPYPPKDKPNVDTSSGGDFGNGNDIPPPKGEDDEIDDESIGANGCICVPYYQCDDGKIIDDGSGIIDPRKKPAEEIPLESGFKPPFCGTFHVCCSEPGSVTQKPYVHNCGIRNPSGINKRILAPNKKGESDFGEWPWQAAVLKSENGVNLFQCGGVLVDQKHILTVAHCVATFAYRNDYNIIIRLGEWDTQTTKEFYPHEDYKVTQIAIHPEYRNASLWNDMAILTLDRKVDYRPNIDTICLPNPNEVFDGQECVTTGWGKNAYRGGSYSNILKEAYLSIMPYHECQNSLRRTRLGKRYKLHDSFMCAGGQEGIDACKGDGGGPLVCYRKDGTYALAGLVSWGIDCGKPGVPGVYVKVQKFLDWISQSTGTPIQDYWPSSGEVDSRSGKRQNKYKRPKTG